MLNVSPFSIKINCSSTFGLASFSFVSRLNNFSLFYLWLHIENRPVAMIWKLEETWMGLEINSDDNKRHEINSSASEWPRPAASRISETKKRFNRVESNKKIREFILHCLSHLGGWIRGVNPSRYRGSQARNSFNNLISRWKALKKVLNGKGQKVRSLWKDDRNLRVASKNVIIEF